MASSLSNLLDNFTEKSHKITCKGCDYFLEYESVKDNLTKYNAHFSIKIILTKFIKNWKRDSRTHQVFVFLNSFCCKERCLSFWVYGWLGKV